MMFFLGCQRAPTFGEDVLRYAKETQSIGDKWHQGEKMISAGDILKSKGEKQVAKGKSMINEGQHRIDKGNTMIDLATQKIRQGEKLKVSSEVDFKEKYSEKLY
ncbi:MAG: hypothetical protein P1U61_03260 [Legionellaceae bacterium]|nr:hypothetical protein [Legionellaceae bacterium]